MQRSATRVVFAGSAIVAATALMWSDTAITWWSNIIEFALRVNTSATTGVLDHRPPGDSVTARWVRERARSLYRFITTCLRVG